MPEGSMTLPDVMVQPAGAARSTRAWAGPRFSTPGLRRSGRRGREMRVVPGLDMRFTSASTVAGLPCRRLPLDCLGATCLGTVRMHWQ